ncbi:MAG: class I SAM-dependent methyltransferase [Gallionella sp.]|nr:class I SAM-dependent methyltransferase [Gallionella sp.]
MKKHLFYAFLLVFLVTATMTLMGVVKIISIDEFYLRGLFGSLLLELIGAILALFKRTDFFSEDTPKTRESPSTTPSNPSIAECAIVGREAYMQKIVEEIKGAKEEIVFTSRTMAQASRDPAQRLINEACVSRADFGEIKHRGIVCANPETALGAISLKQEAKHIEIAFNTHQLELHDMSYFIVDRKRVILGVGRETTKTSFLLESKALAHLLLSHFDRLWNNSIPMHIYLEKAFQDACLEVGEKAALEIVGFETGEKFQAWLKTLPLNNTKPLPYTDRRYDPPRWRLDDILRRYLASIVSESIQSNKLSNDLVESLKELVQYAERIDYDVHAYSFLYLYYVANYYKTRYSLSRAVETHLQKSEIRVLDLGCGSGASTLAIADWFQSTYKNCQLYIDAVDINKQQIGLLTRVIDETSIFTKCKITTYNQDATEYLSNCPHKYDLILDGNFICEINTERRSNVISLVHRRLLHDGVLVSVERNSSGVHEQLKSSRIFTLLSQEVMGPLDIPTSDCLSNSKLVTPSKRTFTVSFSSYATHDH